MKPHIQTFLLILVMLNIPVPQSPSLPVSQSPSLPVSVSSTKYFLTNTALALPPPEDIPEEVLRTEIILEGRSPIDGKPLSTAEYEELKTEIAESSNSPKINQDIQEVIFLLQLRKLVKTIIPFY